MPSFQAVIYFLLIWTAVSIPLGMLLGAMIKFGAGESRPSDQTDRKFEEPSLVRQRDPVVAEKRTMARFSARQSREGIYSSAASPLAGQEVRTAMTERAYGQVGLLSPDSERGDSFGTPKKQSS